MQSHTISNSNLLEALNLGIYDLVNDISDTKKKLYIIRLVGELKVLC